MFLPSISYYDPFDVYLNAVKLSLDLPIFLLPSELVFRTILGKLLHSILFILADDSSLQHIDIYCNIIKLITNSSFVCIPFLYLGSDILFNVFYYQAFKMSQLLLSISRILYRNNAFHCVIYIFFYFNLLGDNQNLPICVVEIKNP